MKSIAIFDLDGTLAESKQPIDAEMGGLLASLLDHMAVANSTSSCSDGCPMSLTCPGSFSCPLPEASFSNMSAAGGKSMPMN